MVTYDVILVGGGFAGLSAAMQLARARRDVLLVDAGRPRNRFARTSHGFLGQDGVPPAQIMREGLTQLARYPTVDFLHAEALSATRGDTGLALTFSDGSRAKARRLILATGVTDELPLASMTPRWGVSVLHCPYCHGYEVRDRRLAAIANAPAAVHQAMILPDWGPTTFFTRGSSNPRRRRRRSWPRAGSGSSARRSWRCLARAPGSGPCGWPTAARFRPRWSSPRPGPARPVPWRSNSAAPSSKA